MTTRSPPEDLKKVLLYTIVVTCVILYQNPDGTLETLILKRGAKEEEGPGLWTIVGGKVEREDWGEAKKTRDGHTVWNGVLERAMKREGLEEIGVELESVSLLPNNNDAVFERKDKTPTLVLRFYAFAGEKFAVKSRKEIKGYAWVGKDELDDPNTYRFIGNVREDIQATMEFVMKKSS